MAKIFGIDLGTTYSCIAFVNDYCKAEVVNNQDSSPITPSVVAFEEGVLGYDAAVFKVE
ncbi:MAG: Hsp70 family protein, partial [Bacteroidales bacterium]|nr:Hsp70 family protein [Bacteroidales bacterium]